MTKALENIRVLDLSRVLAGPFCTQMLGDLGAEVIKVERPGTGDDTRAWGPPFVKDANGKNTNESAYYLSCNRNKKSIAIDIATQEGQKVIRGLIAKSDILIENFKVDGLKKYGLSYDDLKDEFPSLIYCSITGFGQNGPMASEPGYDFLAQAMTGLMTCTGEPGSPPMKVGVALSDVITGLNAAVGILAALNHRTESGKGQHIDVALTDCTLASLTNIAQYYLTSGQNAPRQGNAHSTIVPYQAFEAKDGHIILAVGNDGQFKRFAKFVSHPEWAEDARFTRNAGRVQNRDVLVPMIKEIMAQHPIGYWIKELHAINVPCGSVNTMDKVFDMEQIQARNMKIEMDHSVSPTPVNLVGSPLNLSETPVSYDSPPPICGEQTDEILGKLLDLSPEDITELKKNGIVDAPSSGD
ncbi:MAG: CoA transferase [Zetaproteobacteria bacterium]|nr:MAG: CoA transferase [Zetaproteobacteria bacterium]